MSKEEKPKEALVVLNEEQTAAMLPDPATVEKRLKAITDFQAVVKANLIEGVDYGIIPGTDKLTLLKPGAEKIPKLMNLADSYVILKEIEDWDKGFFYFYFKCQLRDIASGVLISEGIGSCNSKEVKYAWRWVFPNQLPDEFMVKGEKGKIPDPKLRTRRIYSKKTKEWYTQIRVKNEAIFDQVNTMQKMGKKRCQVDASLNVGRLSGILTQDMEDLYEGFRERMEEEEEKTEAKKEEAKPKEKPKEEKPKEKPKEAKPEPEKKKVEPVPETATPPEESEDPLENAAFSQEEEEIAASPSGKDQHDQVNKLLDTLEKTYKREAKDIVVKIHKVVSEKFQVVRKRIPEDLTMAEIYFVIERLNDTMVNEQKKRANAGGPL